MKLHRQTSEIEKETAITACGHMCLPLHIWLVLCKKNVTIRCLVLYFIIYALHRELDTYLAP